MMRRVKSNRKGFTLMEVMVAIAIVAIVSGPLLQTFITSSRVGRRSYDTDKANAVSVKTVEAIKSNPGDINETNYGYIRTYNAALGKYIHTFTRTQYCAVNWGDLHDTNPDGDYPFSVVTRITAEEDASAGVDSLSYLPELVKKATGENYRIEAVFESMIQGTYALRVVSDGTDYTVSSSQSILKKTLGGGTTGTSHVIPDEDCVSGILPVVVDIGNSTGKSIAFEVDNQTGIELGLYIYGDYYHEPPSPAHYVTASLSSGVMNVTYMKVVSATLSYDKLNVNVKVLRNADGSEITDYTTMIYLAG